MGNRNVAALLSALQGYTNTLCPATNSDQVRGYLQVYQIGAGRHSTTDKQAMRQGGVPAGRGKM
eukprot:scaffold72055_cov29-Prasinocladus_malaysianus.AAC.1